MKLIFKDKKQETEDIYSFVFSSPQETNWIAGQTIGLELETEYVTEERHFTISSAPYEKDITITTRVSVSDFKQTLNKLKLGDEIEAFAIGGGDFVWENKPSIFIAGGIGITPYFSMLKQLSYEKQQPESIDLFYSAKQDKRVFAKELDSLEKKIENLHIEYVTDKRITVGLVKQKVSHIDNQEVYISGPPKMVDELSEEFVDELNVSKQNLKGDWFTGLK